MKLAYLLAACLPALCQTPKVPTVIKAPGDPVTLEITANSEKGKEPVVLRWDVVFPPQVMEMEGHGPELASAAKEAGKSIQCTAPKPYRYACVVSGGPNTIADGLVALFHFRILATAEAKTATLRVENGDSTTADSKRWHLNDTETLVIIR
jgi:hypothetical protein